MMDAMLLDQVDAILAGEADAILAGEPCIGLRVQCCTQSGWSTGTVVQRDGNKFIVQLDDPERGHPGGMRNLANPDVHPSGFWFIRAGPPGDDPKNPISDEIWLPVGWSPR